MVDEDVTRWDGEIVGIYCSNNGRSCEMHECCGETLEADQVLRFKKELVFEDGEVIVRVKVVRIHNGQEKCHVGYLPRVVVRYMADKYIEQFAVVMEIYKESEEAYKNVKSRHNGGMASFRLIQDIPSNP